MDKIVVAKHTELLWISPAEQSTSQTFAARGSIVGVSRWAVATCSAARRVCALPFVVTTAVVLQASA